MPSKAGRFGLIVLVLVVLLVGGTAFWTWVTMTWSYSEGERSGVLQKFSKKGWVCKTFEGELAQYVVAGVAPQIWYFSTRDEALAKQLFTAVGQPIQVHYKEHRAIPISCIADTPYFAESFVIVRNR